MIYLISQITFIFLTQIYYNMNFITLSSISSQDFPGTLRSIFVDYFWKKFLKPATLLQVSDNCTLYIYIYISIYLYIYLYIYIYIYIYISIYLSIYR